jgi:hypothetical protein
MEERGIWESPADVPYVDGKLFESPVIPVSRLIVLTTKKEVNENQNRKDYATDKWEQEVRDSLAKKKSATAVVLSKADKALVAAQLVKEADIRTRIAVEQAKLRRGIELVASLADSKSPDVYKHVQLMARMLLGSVFGAGSFLVDGRAFTVFLVRFLLVYRTCG